MANIRKLSDLSISDLSPEARSRISSKVKVSDIDQVNVIDNVESEGRTTKCHSFIHKVLQCVLQHIPVLNWLPKYNWKRDILRDTIAGITVSVMHLPHGMAYAILGHVAPIHGIYMAFFPVIVYFIFSTSRHVSVGTFAVVCLMTGQITDKCVRNETNVTSKYSAIEVGAAISFMVGLWHIVLYCLHLGIASSILSGTLVTSFTAGAAVHVFTSQVKELLGLKLNTKSGVFGLYYTYKQIILNVKQTNVYTIVVSSITLVILTIDAFLFAPWFRKRMKFELPSQLITMLLANVLSKLINFEKYGITIIGYIPKGLPPLAPPPFSLLTHVAEGSFYIMIVSYSVSMSMAKLFATESNYNIDTNQELLAFGLANVTGSFFQCLPVSTSLSRSIIQKLTGGRTQIASIVSCLILLAILLWIGPFFEHLPKCVLSGIIVVSLKRMLLQIKLIPKIWKLSKIDAVVWVGTFLSVVVFEVKYGLLIGIILTLIHVFIQNMTPDIWLLGTVKLTLYERNDSSYKYIFVNATENVASEIVGTKIIRISESLTFATENHIKNEIYLLSGVDPQEVLKLRRRMKRNKATSEQIREAEENKMTVNFKVHNLSSQSRTENEMSLRRDQLRYIIVDLKSIKYVDSSGLTALKRLIQNYNEINIFVVTISNFDAFESNVESIEDAFKLIGSQFPM